MAKTVLNQREKTLRMVQIALLAALEVILTLWYLPIGTINLNFGLVPIVIAGVCLSPLCGALIGTVSGLVTMFQVISGQSVFYAFLMANNPVAACVLCVVKTAAAGYVAGLVYRILTKNGKHQVLGSISAAVLCPALNTGIFALGMLTVFAADLVADPVISTWGGNVFAIVFLALIGVNFFVELALSLVVCPVITRTLLKTRFFRK